ncbi:hypothetical protein MSAN_01007900 [Mycena sanguinolenta]|uniref:Uncharacterized protein n=1 Tax=Mycena sanguinolenta TaxID=230812 RepID=A0A8H6YSG4_9AGAR|nr:hypothetical protein MSAN_01007900 [Mycena sanguinolenta]
MAPSGKSRIPYNLPRDSQSRPFPIFSNRLARTNKKATPTPTPLTRQQIEYLVAKASEKSQQKDRIGVTQPWTAVPNPVPDTGIPPTIHHIKPSSTVASSSSVLSRSLSSSIVPSSTSVLPTVTFRSPGITPATASSARTTSENQNNVSTPFTTHRLPTPAITLIAVAGACFLLALFVSIKICVRPTRRPRPVPSRPILDDSFSDEVLETKLEDSPVFGGRERLSERPENTGLWTWTQYPTPATAAAAPNDSAVPSVRSDAPGNISYAGRDEKRSYSSTDLVYVPSTQTPTNSPYPAPIQQVHNALTRAASRLSTVSVYPATPSSNLVTTFTADGYPVMERVTPKVLQRSRSSTVGERNHRERPPSRANRYSCGFAYGGAEVQSPTLPTVPPPKPGRTRIKSSYYAHPRTSTMPPSQSTRSNVRDEDAHKALASALNLDSPATVYLSSPQPTLYPDDSLSVVEAKRTLKPVNKKPAPSNRSSRVFGRADDNGFSASPTVDATAALGNLMLMDFSGTGESTANLASTSSATLAPKKTFRSDDKPPRVPSPPPLPSLSQMALEHANPEAYANYRSPTYSIYGLYEGDGKSRASLHG